MSEPKYKQLNSSAATINQLLADNPQNTADLKKVLEAVNKLSKDTTIAQQSMLPADGIPKENTVYALGQLTRLNLSKGVPNSPKETVIIFTASSSGCEITVSLTQPRIGSLSTQPNFRYVLSIQNGIIIMSPLK